LLRADVQGGDPITLGRDAARLLREQGAEALLRSRD
jgi:hypothetical protein